MAVVTLALAHALDLDHPLPHSLTPGLGPVSQGTDCREQCFQIIVSNLFLVGVITGMHHHPECCVDAVGLCQ